MEINMCVDKNGAVERMRKGERGAEQDISARDHFRSDLTLVRSRRGPAVPQSPRVGRVAVAVWRVGLGSRGRRRASRAAWGVEIGVRGRVVMTDDTHGHYTRFPSVRHSPLHWRGHSAALSISRLFLHKLVVSWSSHRLSCSSDFVFMRSADTP